MRELRHRELSSLFKVTQLARGWASCFTNHSNRDCMWKQLCIPMLEDNVGAIGTQRRAVTQITVREIIETLTCYSVNAWAPLREQPDTWGKKEGALVGQVCTGHLSGSGREEDAERGRWSVESADMKAKVHWSMNELLQPRVNPEP
jgi:hypothetical protein